MSSLWPVCKAAWRRLLSFITSSHSTHLVCVGFDWDAERPAQAKIGNLQALLLVVHEQVLRFQIAVHYAVLVAMGHALDQLVHEALQPIHGLARDLLGNVPGKLFRLTTTWTRTATLIVGAGRGWLGPLPFRSMNFFRSVLRNSNTCRSNTSFHSLSALCLQMQNATACLHELII